MDGLRSRQVEIRSQTGISFLGWKILSYLIPYTWAAHGFIHINSMGATLWTTRTEYWALWGLTAAYFVLAVTMLFIAGYLEDRKERLAAQPESGLDGQSSVQEPVTT